MRSITIFCGSRDGHDPRYIEQARELGLLLAGKGLRIVFGGGRKGLMGALADGMLEGGGLVTGIIPKLLLEWEVQHTGVTELIITESMHERKVLLYKMCDVAIVLPGGYGTLDEMFELLTWNQLNLHDKKLLVLNTAGFYDHLHAHMQHLFEQGFLYGPVADRVRLFPDPISLVEALTKN
jgi:uncharacterized protein (TIGR00730 family)